MKDVVDSISINLMFITSYFAFDPRSIRGGIGHRYVGLYGSLAKVVLKKGHKVFWYSNKDCNLRIIHQNKILISKSSFSISVIKAVYSSIHNDSSLAVVMAYPHSIPRVYGLLEYLASLALLNLLKTLFPKRITTVVDDFDPPVEAAYAFSEAKPSTLTRIYGRILEMLTLKLASSIITISEFWVQHMARIYHVRQEKIIVVSNGSLVRHIHCKPTETEGPLTILYAGSAMKVKDIDKLVLTVAKLREKGLHIDLHIAGAKLMDLPQWVPVAQGDWPSFVDGILFQSDVCVIPYPPNRLTFFHAVPAKLFDYMGACKPIISTNLKEVSGILKKFNCGLVARDWTEFELHLKRLYHDRELAKKLGQNGREAAEKYFDYERLAEALLDKLVKTFESEY